MMIQGNTGVTPDPRLKARSIGMTIDASANITIGHKGQIQIPFNGTIFKWTLMGDVPGNIEIDVLKDSYAAYPPFVGTSIAGSELPHLTASAKAQDEALSTWSTAVSAGDLIGFKVNSVDTVKRATLILWLYE